jgi:surface antigen
VVRSRTVRPDRLPPYSGTPAQRLSCPSRESCRAPLSRRVARPLAAIAAAILLGLATAGCSYKLSGFGKDDGPEQTSAVTPIRAPDTAASASPGTLPPDADLAVTKAAVQDVLSRGTEDSSLPWENPRTGARGIVTPIASSYTQDGFTCRDFLASYVRDGAESWLQGEACRLHRGKWEVKNLRPLRKSSLPTPRRQATDRATAQSAVVELR